MPCFGLFGKNLTHSFSPSYFKNKWVSLGELGNTYDIIELDDPTKFADLKKDFEDYKGFNVTIPYKQSIIPYVDKLSPLALELGAVNCIKNKNGKWEGYNTDAEAFLDSLVEFIGENKYLNAIVLGSGGASKAICWALKQLKISFYTVSRNSKSVINYENINLYISDNQYIIINCTPVGQFPNVGECPNLDYNLINERFYLYDLIYNPEKTLFLSLGERQGAKIKNGYDMLVRQAERSWKIWNQ